MPDDVDLVVPLEVLVSAFEDLPVVLEVAGALRAGVLVREVAQRPVVDGDHFEALAVYLEGVARLGIGVSAVGLRDLAGQRPVAHPLGREQRVGTDLAHVRAFGHRGKTVLPARRRRSLTPEVREGELGIAAEGVGDGAGSDVGEPGLTELRERRLAAGRREEHAAAHPALADRLEAPAGERHQERPAGPQDSGELPGVPTGNRTPLAGACEARSMRHARFRDPAGAVRTGTFDGDSVSFAGRTYGVEEVDLLAPTDPPKIVCVGLNYADHAAESNAEIPDRPLLFLKTPNTVSNHGATVELPAGKDRIDWEAEFGVVIDRQCRDVDADDAWNVVRGFTCVNDISNRDDQNVEQNWVRGKSFDGAAPLGPAVAPPEAVPEDASIELRVNGETKQSSTREEFIFSVPELVEEITTYMTLEAGDIISTGTPAGVGPFSDGDTAEVEIEGVGTLEHDVTIPEA